MLGCTGSTRPKQISGLKHVIIFCKYYSTVVHSVLDIAVLVALAVRDWGVLYYSTILQHRGTTPRCHSTTVIRRLIKKKKIG